MKTIDQLETELSQLLNENEELKNEIAEIIKLVRQIIGVLGLLDASGKSIKPELLSGQESVFSLLLSSLSDIIGLITKSKMPLIGHRYEKKLEEQFSFVKEIVPIVQKYVNQ